MIKGSKVHLRLLREADIEEFTRLNQDLQNRGEFIPSDLHSETSMRARFRESGFWSEDRGVMVVVEPESDRMIGTFVFFKGVPYMDGYEVGYSLFHPEDRGKGIATEVLQLATRYMFMTFKVRRLQVAANTDNVASVRVAEKCGSQREGILRGMAFNRGKHEDMVLLSILRDEVCLEDRTIGVKS